MATALAPKVEVLNGVRKAAILTVVLAFNFLGDALRDALDPRSQEAVQGRAL